MKKSFVLVLMLLVVTLVSGLRAGSSMDSYYIKRALEAIQAQDYETGAKFLSQELDENPTNGYAYAYLAALCDMMTGYNGAKFMFAKKALPLLPKNEKDLKAGMEAFQGALYEQADDTAKAKAYYRKAIGHNPASPRYYGYLATVQENADDFQGLYELGDAMVNKLKGLNKEPLSYIILVSGLNGLKRYDEAFAAADKGLKLKDIGKNQQCILLQQKTKALMGQKRYEEALSEAMKTAALSPQRGVQLLVEIADSSDMQVVLDTMEAAFEREPSQMLWPLAESDIYARHNNYVQAVYQILRGAKVGDNSRVYRMAGNYVVHFLGDPEMAESLYREGLKKDSTDAAIWGYLADLYHDLGRYEDALRATDQALRLDPEQKEMEITYSIRGRAYLSMHNYLRAIEEYSRALVSENDLDSWPRIAMMYRKLGDEVSAQRTIEQGLLEMKKDTTMDMLLIMGDTLKAKAKAPKMVRKQSSANQQYNAACMYSRMNMPDEALAALRKSLECGFRNFYHFAWDDDIDNIRDLPEFKAMMEEYKAKVKEEQAELRSLLENAK